jgi:hypothetical protein
VKGDKFVEKRNNITRLSQNINSLKPRSIDKWKNTIEQSHQLKIDILGLPVCETCINWDINELRTKYQQTLSKQYKVNAMMVSKRVTKNTRSHLLGGTITITMDKWTQQTKKMIKDDFNNRTLHTISAYRVINHPITTHNTLSTNKLTTI